jgi:hypothetical protein
MLKQAEGGVQRTYTGCIRVQSAASFARGVLREVAVQQAGSGVLERDGAALAVAAVACCLSSACVRVGGAQSIAVRLAVAVAVRYQ